MTRPEWITPEDGPWLCTVHGMLEEAADGSTHCPDCTLAELAEVRGLLREALRKQGTEMVDIAFAREQIARAERAEAALADVKLELDQQKRLYELCDENEKRALDLNADLRRELTKARGLLESIGPDTPQQSFLSWLEASLRKSP